MSIRGKPPSVAALGVGAGADAGGGGVGAGAVVHPETIKAIKTAVMNIRHTYLFFISVFLL
jgi:hypothetical protein